MRQTEVELVDEIRELTLRRLRRWERRGWVVPAIADEGPAFDEIDKARLRLICDLKHGMELSDDATEIVLSLIDQLHGARNELRALATAIDAQPKNTREKIRKAFRLALDP